MGFQNCTSTWAFCWDCNLCFWCYSLKSVLTYKKKRKTNMKWGMSKVDRKAGRELKSPNCEPNIKPSQCCLSWWCGCPSGVWIFFLPAVRKHQRSRKRRVGAGFVVSSCQESEWISHRAVSLSLATPSLCLPQWRIELIQHVQQQILANVMLLSHDNELQSHWINITYC